MIFFNPDTRKHKKITEPLASSLSSELQSRFFPPLMSIDALISGSNICSYSITIDSHSEPFTHGKGIALEDRKARRFIDAVSAKRIHAQGYNAIVMKAGLSENVFAFPKNSRSEIASNIKSHFLAALTDILPEKFHQEFHVNPIDGLENSLLFQAVTLAQQLTGRKSAWICDGVDINDLDKPIKQKRLSFPDALRCPFGVGGEQSITQLLHYIEKKLADPRTEKPAAIVVAPIVDDGTYIAPRRWLKGIATIAKAHQIKLILDEQFSGSGQSAEYFAYEYANIIPDIVCFCHRLDATFSIPLLAVRQHLITKDALNAWTENFDISTILHLGTQVLRQCQYDVLFQQAKCKSTYLQDKLTKLARYPCIAEVRGRGLIAGIEVCNPDGQKNQFGEPKADPALASSIHKEAMTKGVILGIGKKNNSVLQLCPAMVVTLEQIDTICDVIQHAIEKCIPLQPREKQYSPLQQSWQQHFIQTGKGGPKSFDAAIQQTTSALVSLFENADSPYSGFSPHHLLQAIKAARLGEHPRALSSVIDETSQLIANHSILVQHPHCIAHLHTPPLIPALAAEHFIATLNQSMDSWDQASSATFIEQEVTDWLCRTVGYAEQSDGVFTSGGTQSNLMGLLLARDHALQHLTGQKVQQCGLPAIANKLRIICSENAHFTMQKSASLLGLGEQSVVCVNTNDNGCIDLVQAKAAIITLKEKGLIPFVVTGTAGTTDRGAIDDIDKLADIAQTYQLWMHVDAAYGGALLLSQARDRLKGIDRADSITVDFHKMFFQPISCGAILLKDNSHFQYIRHHADYLNREDDTLPNLVDKSIATTRRFDALKLWMTIQNLGADTLGKMVDHLLHQAKEVADRIKQKKHFELLASPSLSTVLFRLIPENTSIDLDSFNKQLRLDALVKGVAVVGETRVNDSIALKFTLLNPCLSMDDFDALLDKLEKLGNEIATVYQAH